MRLYEMPAVSQALCLDAGSSRRQTRACDLMGKMNAVD